MFLDEGFQLVPLVVQALACFASRDNAQAEAWTTNPNLQGAARSLFRL